MLRIGTFLFVLINFVYAQNNIAVMNFKNNGPEELAYLSSGIADMLVTSLSKSSTIQIIERSSVEALIRDKEIKEDSFVDNKSVSELGKIIETQFFVVGSYTKLGSAIRIDTKIINVETGDIIPKSVSSIKSETIETIDISIDLMAETLLSKLTGEPAEKIVAGNPKEDAIFEWSYTDGKFTLAIDGRVLKVDEEKTVLKLSHGKHKFDIYTGGFLPVLLRTEYHKLAGGYTHNATFEDGQIKIELIEAAEDVVESATIILNEENEIDSIYNDSLMPPEVMSEVDYDKVLIE